MKIVVPTARGLGAALTLSLFAVPIQETSAQDVAVDVMAASTNPEMKGPFVGFIGIHNTFREFGAATNEYRE